MPSYDVASISPKWREHQPDSADVATNCLALLRGITVIRMGGSADLLVGSVVQVDPGLTPG